MNHPRVKRAMNAAFLELMSLEPAELRRQIEEHADGPLAALFLESGMIAGRQLIVDDQVAQIHYLVEPAMTLKWTVQGFAIGLKAANQQMAQPGSVTVTRGSGVQSDRWNTIALSDYAWAA
jgi:hypothetical protein